MLATSSGDQTAKIWRTSDFSRSIAELPCKRWVWDIAWTCSHSEYLFTASSDGIIKLWNVKEDASELAREFNGHQKPVTALALADVLIDS